MAEHHRCCFVNFVASCFVRAYWAAHQSDIVMVADRMLEVETKPDTCREMPSRFRFCIAMAVAKAETQPDIDPSLEMWLGYNHPSSVEFVGDQIICSY